MEHAKYTLTIQNVEDVLSCFGETPDRLAKVLNDLNDEVVNKKNLDSTIVVNYSDEGMAFFMLKSVVRRDFIQNERGYMTNNIFEVTVSFTGTGS